MNDPATVVREPDKGIDAIAAGLGKVRARARRLLLARAVCPLLAGVVAFVVGVGLLDYATRLPALLRGVLLLAAAGALVELVRRTVVPAARFSPGLTEMALRLEGTPTGERAGLRGLLASGLELSASPADPRPAAAWLRDQVVGRARRAFDEAGGVPILKPAAARRAVLGAALAGAVALSLWLWSPSLSAIAARRVLAPWADVSWPKRTGVVDATAVAVHPIGSALPLRAALVKTDQPPGETQVVARYRVMADGRAGPMRRAPLSPQRRTIEVFADEDTPGGSGELFERLIEPATLAAGDSRGPVEVEYWFETADDSTKPARVLLVEPPRVVGASATVEPPAYAGAAVAGGSAIVAGTLDLGPGSDSRAVAGPILAGSRVRLDINLNKGIPLWREGAAETWAAQTLGDARFAASLQENGPFRVTLGFTLTESIRLPVTLTDEHGLTGTEEAIFTLEVVQDRAPSASVTEPPEDEAVLASAVIEVAGEGRDDAGLAWVALEQQLARPPPGSIGAPAEAAGEFVELTRRTVHETSPMQARASARLDLSTLGLIPGDEVWLTALAKDTYDLDGVGHEPVRSTVRRLRIISDDQLVEQIRAELSGVRRSAMRLDEGQAEVAERAQREGATPETRSGQAGLTERLASQRQALSRLLDRAERNNLDDPTLEGLLEEAGSLMQDAAEASAEASEALNSAREPEAGMTPEARERTAEAQERVRDDLGRLVDLLDRGEDSWLVRRDLERLIADQRSLMEQTRAATEETIGREASQLTPQERAALEQIAQRQGELADRAEQAMQDLRERAEQTREQDPAQADAMERAAERGRQENVPNQMRNAAQSAQANRGQSAQQQQQQAAEALEQMREDLENAQRDRDEVLRRILMSVADSLRGLIAHQQRELASLATAAQTRDFTGLDAGMSALHRNTLALAAQVRAAARELAALADLVESAATPQGAAVRTLRAAPVDEGAARGHEEVSLARLQEALADAERMAAEAAQRSADRRRAELRRAYREILEQQVALRGETETYADKELARKQRVMIRRLGVRQDEIAARLQEVRGANAEVKDAAVIDFAHDRMATLSGRAGRALGEGEATRAVVRDQDGVIRILQSLIESLNDRPRGDGEEDFREGQGGQGQGQQQQDQLIPPIAELRMLRSLQVAAAEETRALDESADATPEQIDDVGALQDSLAEQGQKLIERLNRPQGGPQGGPPGGAGGTGGGS